jgi:two-component system sensor histidine kinase/response regulator
MPGMDGLTLARAIKADLPIAGTRIVALTSLGQAHSAEELRLADIASYLVKPIKQSRLFDCLVYIASKAPVPGIDAKPNVSAAPALSFQVDPNAGKTRVLVAEDNRTNQLVAVGMLRKLGCEADIFLCKPIQLRASLGLVFGEHVRSNKQA